MVYPPITRESTNRSSVEALNFYQTQSTAPSILLHQPQLYTPYNPVYTCAQANLTQQYIYTNTRRSPASSSVTLRGQDSLRNIKNPKWFPKSHGIRIKDYPTNSQHPLSYTQPPLVLYDPVHHLSPAPSVPLTPVYFNQAASFHPNSYLTEPYASVHPNLIPQSFYKPSEVQTFCLIPDQSQNQFSSQKAIQQTYYNIPGSLTLQNVKLGFHSSSVAYPTNTGVQEEKFVPVVSNQLFSNSVVSSSNLNSSLSDKLSLQENQSNKSSEEIALQTERRLPYTENFAEVNQSDFNSLKLKPDPLKNIQSLREEKYSDEFSCFDFTIEAEKMVSALCNTSFHELEKDEEKCEEENHHNSNIKIENEVEVGKENHDEEAEENDENSFTSPEKTDQKCTENIHKNFNPWHLELLKKEPTISTTSVGTQTLDFLLDESQYPELIRKTINYGCNEAEKILKNNSFSITRQNWLNNLSSGTKIACAKSSTCFPVFLGDEIFSQDLINALMRISNGWLILDHYFNKQHQPSLGYKFDRALVKSLKHWEISTNDLLKRVIKTFIQLGSNLNQDDSFNSLKNSNSLSSSFPGDVCLYVNFGLFGESLGKFQPSQIPLTKTQTVDRNLFCSSNLVDDNQEQKQWLEKESKSKTKWTITEQSQPNLFQKFFADKSEWKMFSRAPSQRTVQYDFFLSHPEENVNREKLSGPFFEFKRTNEHYPSIPKYSNAVNFTSNINSNFSTNVGGSIPSILSTDKHQPFWNSYFNQTSYNNFSYNDSNNLSNLKNKMTLLSQIETKNTKMQKSNAVEGETINLSAWFASMRNKRVSNIEISSSTRNSTNWWEATSNVSVKTKESLKNNEEHIGSSKNEINRQIQTLKNMRTIQTAPWIANQLINNKKDLKNPHEENDSAEDARVYMKPGSYKVPKKKYQSRRSQRRSESKNKIDSSKLSPRCFEYENSTSKQNHLIPSRKNNSSSSSSISSQDVTWKAACASAELLLSSLNITPSLKPSNKSKVIQKNSEKNKNDVEKVKNKQEYEEISDNQENLENKKTEVTENQIETSKFIPLNNDSSSGGRLRTSIKTDSWLIKTLKDVSDEANNKSVIDNATKLDKDNICNDKSEDKKEIESSLWENLSKNPDNNEKSSLPLETNHTIAVMTLVDVVEKATYSETVRRYFQMRNRLQRNFKRLKSERKGKALRVSLIASTRKKKFGILNKRLQKQESTIESYRKVVKNPVFLETIGYKLRNHVYRKADHVIRDFRKIVHNSKLFYKNNNESMANVEALSKKLEELVEKHFSQV
ncbi:LOW QUALITY PROTEIN: uncharacterized protein [Chelonus insularis]|uniref:LOW QUALITY PROTEIN: uncharacterized protein n=1 Tax=Chelonus insularis TaxID=460826 RepID=UPI00158E070F|nr:LOW QUALITY PROTEIN: uncharacterized protein LOC118064305 [Chelonus insularis]